MIQSDLQASSKSTSAPQEARATEDFLASLAYFAHEAKAPLAAMRETLHWVAESESVTPAVRRACGRIQNQIEDLLRILDDIGEPDLQHLDLWLEPLDLARILSEAVDMLGPMFEAKSQVVLNVFEPGPIWVRGDRMRLSQVISNLIANASKFSPSHSRIEVSALSLDGEVTISIRDQGIGLDARDLDHLFEPDLESEKLEMNGSTGGIGLALVRRIVGMHQGEIEANSEGMGRGSEFVVRLPLVSEPSPA